MNEIANVATVLLALALGYWLGYRSPKDEHRPFD